MSLSEVRGDLSRRNLAIVVDLTPVALSILSAARPERAIGLTINPNCLVTTHQLKWESSI